MLGRPEGHGNASGVQVSSPLAQIVWRAIAAGSIDWALVALSTTGRCL